MTSQTKVFEEKALRVAHRVTDQAESLGRMYTTSSLELAKLVAATLESMTTAENRKEVENHVKALIDAREVVTPGIDVWTFLCLITNYLSWAWHSEGEEELSKAWSEAWHEIHEYSLDHLKGNDLKYYVQKTD